jgi:hypothetical protein
MADLSQKHQGFKEAFLYYFRTEREGYTVQSAAQLSAVSGVPVSRIENWIKKEVGRPREWRDLVRLAKGVGLSREETNIFLTSSGHHPIERLSESSSKTEDVELLAFWDRQEQTLDDDSQDQIKALYERFIPPGLKPEDFDAYLNFLIEKNRWLTLPDQKGSQIELERVYVSLRADEIATTERVYESRRAQREVEAYLAEQLAEAPYEASRAAYVYTMLQNGMTYTAISGEN